MNEYKKCSNGSLDTISDEISFEKKEAESRIILRQIYLIENFENILTGETQKRELGGFDFLTRGQYYYKLELYDKAIDDFNISLKYYNEIIKEYGHDNHESLIDIYFYMGLCYLNQKDISNASKMFNNVYELEEKFNKLEYGWGYICKGVNYFSIGDIKVACEYFNKANKNGNIRDLLGGILCKIVQECNCKEISFYNFFEDEPAENVAEVNKFLENLLKSRGFHKP